MAYIKELTDDLVRVVAYIGSSNSSASGQKQKTFKRPKNVSVSRWRKSYHLTMANEWEDEIKANPELKKDIKLEDFVELWKSVHAKTNLDSETLTTYEGQLKHHILPPLGHMLISRITPTSVQKIVNNRIEDGKSRRTAKLPKQVLSSILGKAVQWGYISENPCAKVTIPKTREEKKVKHYEIDDLKILFQAIQKEESKYQAFFYIALSGGLRRSEILRLKFEDVKNDGVYVRKGKNESSVRFVSLDEATMTIVKRHMRRQKQLAKSLGWEDTYLFTQENGSKMDDDTPTKKLRKICQENNVPWATLHGLRHTMVTILLNQNVDVRSVSSRVGHSRQSTTTDIYGHLLKGKDEQAKDVISTALEKVLIKSV